MYNSPLNEALNIDGMTGVVLDRALAFVLFSEVVTAEQLRKETLAVRDTAAKKLSGLSGSLNKKKAAVHLQMTVRRHIANRLNKLLQIVDKPLDEIFDDRLTKACALAGIAKPAADFNWEEVIRMGSTHPDLAISELDPADVVVAKQVFSRLYNEADAIRSAK